MVVLFTWGNIQFPFMKKPQQIIITIFFSYCCGNEEHCREELSMAQRACKASIRQGIAGECTGGVKVVSAVKLINKCFILFLLLKKIGKKRKKSQDWTQYCIWPQLRACYGCLEKKQKKWRAGFFTKLLQIPVLASPLPTGSQIGIFLACF